LQAARRSLKVIGMKILKRLFIKAKPDLEKVKKLCRGPILEILLNYVRKFGSYLTEYFLLHDQLLILFRDVVCDSCEKPHKFRK